MGGSHVVAGVALAGPESHSVSIEVSNGTMNRRGDWDRVGASNTAVGLRRGMQTAKMTASRVGRVKCW
jgi:hypothetical protein